MQLIYSNCKTKAMLEYQFGWKLLEYVNNRWIIIGVVDHGSQAEKWLGL